jgi:ferredoxin
MAERTGPLGHRIQPDYFKKRRSIRRIKVLLSIVAIVTAGAWLIAEALRSHSHLYSPGDLSSQHAFVEKDCVTCHTGTQGAVFSRAVTDNACETCHSGAIHHANQIFEGRTGVQPACSACHEEHRGRIFRSAMVRDNKCTECHSHLPQATAASPSSSDPKRPAAGFTASISSFAEGHPEFRVIAEHETDNTPIKLNHRKHLRPDLPGPNGTAVQMQCADCHHTMQNGLMAPIEFARDCQSCHPLAFDERIFEQAPHEEPVIIEAFIRTAFSKYTNNKPNEWKTDPDWHPARKLADLRRMVDEAPRNLPLFLETQIRAATHLLFEKKCQECHIVQNLEAAIPVLAKPQIPKLWLTHASFSHTPHRMLQCQACHKGAPESSLTSDVLLPSRSDCLNCHTPSAAPTTCATCHTYHPKS